MTNLLGNKSYKSFCLSVLITSVFDELPRPNNCGRHLERLIGHNSTGLCTE